MKRMNRTAAGCAALLLLAGTASAQDQWTLRQCVDYAIENSTLVQQRALQQQDQELSLNTSRNSRLPSLSANASENFSFGRSAGRDGVYTDVTRASSSVGLNTSVPVFAGFRIRNDIAAREFDLQAALHDLARVKDDVAVNVTSLYLQVLFNKELLGVAQSQVELSRQQVDRSQKLFDAGRSPESAIYESRALVARDELTLTQAENSLALSLLDLAQALNLPQIDGFDIKAPSLNNISLSALFALREQPESIFGYAVTTRPVILAEQSRLESSRKTLGIAKAARYPQISLGAGYSNSYYYSFSDNASNQRFIDQIRNNGSESIGLNLSIPIFNRLSTRNQIHSANLNIQNRELALSEAERTLRKEIEQAYQNTTASYKKFQSADESAKAARIAFRYEEEKANAGRSTTFDYNDAKTRLERSESEMIQAKYEFLFYRKILDFYLDVPLDF
ncbi:MAG: TolC family protein [Rikenellaceae bacterium]|nr:TolC family protein [Rikenellaceae bacterium]